MARGAESRGDLDLVAAVSADPVPLAGAREPPSHGAEPSRAKVTEMLSMWELRELDIEAGFEDSAVSYQLHHSIAEKGHVAPVVDYRNDRSLKQSLEGTLRPRSGHRGPTSRSAWSMWAAA
jgi:hypothetical protein